MARLRRSQFLLFTLEEFGAGSGCPSSWVVTSPLSGQHVLVGVEELDWLRTLSSSEWIEEEVAAKGLSPSRLAELVLCGVVFSDQVGSPSEIYQQREERLNTSHWPPCAAVFHLLSQYQESQNAPLGSECDTSLRELEAEERAVRFLEENGPPPPTFYCHPDSLDVEDLPLVPMDSEVAFVLSRRRTCRHFDPESLLSAESLSQLLRLVFGPVAVRTVAERVEFLLKTSPSGGSLHPIEAFPLLFRCEGLMTGIYHYRCDRHAIALIRAIPEKEARGLAIHLAQGQSFVGTCATVVLLVARFGRNFWKYRERENSYSVVLQDAGHLAQSFQVVATSMGLGSFYTAAINTEAIEELLNLGYPALAPIGLLGVGAGGSELDLPGVAVSAFLPRR